MRSLGSLLVAVLAILLVGSAAGAQQWSNEHSAAQGPRFLLASAPAPIPVDVRRVAILRQRITLDLPDATLDEALAAITRQSGIHFMYSTDVLRRGGHVRLRAQDITVAAALTEVLLDAGVDVVLTPSGQALLTRHKPLHDERVQTGVITGTVSDAVSGAPVSSAAVVVEGTRLGATTNDSGQYRIPSVPPGAQTVSARRIGYTKLTEPVTVTADQEVRVDFALQPSKSVLEQVVVTATGAVRTREIGNAISTIDAAQVARAPASDVQDILTGRSSGVTILQNSGQPGAGGTIRLRGISSISQGNSPLIYVDGVRIYNGTTGETGLGRQTTNPFNDIDPSDIDHIEIVKGPAATTLYGTEASGGVIQIFTKHGLTGRAPLWTAEVTQGFNKMGHVGPKSDPTGLFMNDCTGVMTNGAGATFEDPTCPSSGSWLRNGLVQRYSANVRGGSGDVTYFVGANYDKEDGVLPAGGTHGGGARANLSFRPVHGLQLGLNSSYAKNRVDWVGDGNQGSGVLLNISRGPNSNFKFGTGCDAAASTCVNNAALFDATSYTRTNHYILGATAKYDADGPFSARLNVGYDYDDYTLQTSYPFGYVPNVPLGELQEGLRNRTFITTDVAANWKQNVGASLLSTTSVGGQVFDSRFTSASMQTQNFAGPGAPVLTSGSLTSITGAADTRVVNAGFFVQELLSWRDRLFVTGALRVDGNSAFGSGFGLQSYPKLSASYVISDEPWFHVPHLDNLKLRGAFGESGKAPGAFDAVRTWSPVAAEDGQPAYTPNQIGNPDLGPERTREIEGGFDLGAFDNRFTLGATYYSQHTFDALIPVQFPPSDGFTSSQLENVGQLRNKGVEMSAGADVIKFPNLVWNARLNYTRVKSTAGSLGGQTITIASLSRTYVKEGYPAPSYFGYKVTNPNAFADPIVDSTGFLGATYPDRIISPATTITLWKRLTLDAIGEWQLGGHLLNATGYVLADQRQDWQPCYATQVKLKAAAAGDPSALNDVTALQRARCALKGYDYAYWVEPTDFFKLRSVSITWDIPSRFAPRFRTASLQIAGRNLWTSTNYTGTDPEIADQSTGTFSRRDYFVFPTYRTFTATLRFGF